MAQTYSGGPVRLQKGLATGKSLSEAQSAALSQKGSKTKGGSTKR